MVACCSAHLMLCIEINLEFIKALKMKGFAVDELYMKK